jgi:hypothetical protein
MRLLIGLIGTMLAVVGCASMQNTPQQDYVWQLGHICDSRTTIYQMASVTPDGRYTVRGASNVIDFKPYLECMREQADRLPYGEWLKQRTGATPR